ncbi:MAG: tetratricopeptide repeat protein, partial [Candidatus Hodarchaeales archaeon]
EYENTFKLQDIVSNKVIRGLKIKFSQDERDRMLIDVPQNPLAYEYYLRSISYPLTIEGHYLAIEILKKSIQLDSTYAPAFAELGYITNLLAQNVFSAELEYEKAEGYFIKALSLNNELLSALSNLAGLYTDIGRTEKAVELAQGSLKINPNNAWTHFRLSYIYRYAGMLNESEKEAEIALKLDPKNPRLRSTGLTYLYLGKYEKALAAFDLDKGSAFTLGFKGATFLRAGESDLALECFNRVLEMEPEGTLGFSAAGLKAYVEKDIEEGFRSARRYEQLNPRDAEVLYDIAFIYGLMGEKTECVRVLEKVIKNGFFNYPFMMRDPFFDNIRDDPEFQRVLLLAKEKHEAFKRKYFPE